MSEIKIVSPAKDLVQKVASRLVPDANDYSKNVVVFPGKRPAHFLRKAIADQLKTGYVPPRVFSIDAFVEHAYRTLLGHDQPKLLTTIDALAILYDVHSGTNVKIGGESYASLDAFLPIGARLIGELEEIVLADLSDRRVREMLGGVEFPMFRALSYYYEEFYHELAHRGYVSRALMYRTVADEVEKIDLNDFRVVIFAGFYAFTNVERKMVASFGRRENVTMIFQDGIGLRGQLSKMSVTADETATAPLPAIHFYRAPDTHGQIFALASKLSEQVKASGAPNERTAIVLPSADALFLVVHHALSVLPDEGNYNIALGYPLGRTPIVGFLSNLIELIVSQSDGKSSSAQYLKFLLHPYTKNIRLGSRSDVTRVFVHAIEEYLVDTHANWLFTLDELENDGEMFEIVSRRIIGMADSLTPERLRTQLIWIHDNTIRKFSDFRSLRDFATKTIGVISFVYDYSTANRHPFSHQYVERLIELLASVQSSLLADRTFDEPAGYFSFVRNLIASEFAPFPGTPVSGLQVLGLLETRNLKFDTLYVLDATDDVLPGSHRDDALLPQPIRKMLGLETYRDREKLIEYYFDLAVRSSRKVHLFYTESGKKEKSRFVQKLLWQIQRRDGKLSTKEYERVVKYRTTLANVRPVAIPKTDAMLQLLRSMRFSAHALDTYLACPLQFHYQYVLRLQEREQAIDELDAANVGMLVHDVLARYFRDLVGVPLTAQHFNRGRLTQIVNEYFAEAFGSDLIGNVDLMRSQVEQHLWQFFERHQIPLVGRERVIVKAIERTFDVEKNGYRFTGRIDRIELRGDTTFIIDYKTSSDESSITIRLDKLTPEDPGTWRDAIKSFQLPVYTLLYSTAMMVDPRSIVPVYLMLGRNQIDGDIEVGASDDASTASRVYTQLEPVVFDVIEQIQNGATPFEPTTEPDKQCPRCPYVSICGMEWIRAEKDWT